jgi:uncharacterized protein YxjI
MQFPLTFSFKLVALASQIYVRDATGRDVLYVHQKLLKLKESITVYADKSKSRPLFHIGADRVIDFRARFDFTDAAGNHLGAVRRQGARSLWRATYDVYLDKSEQKRLTIREERPWVKLLDSVVSDIPVIGIFGGYVLNPSYQVVDAKTDAVTHRVTKKRALLESRFTVERLAATEGGLVDTVVLLAMLTAILLERSRG